jgi:hypothetical protein
VLCSFGIVQLVHGVHGSKAVEGSCEQRFLTRRKEEIMNSKFAAFAAGLTLAAGSAISSRAATAVVNFETNPLLGTGPSIYVAVPGPQTITTPEATFSGGVVLGFATFFPAIAFATPPNVYGTADFGNHLPEQLTIDINPAFTTTEVSFALFNGEVFNQSYKADAFNGTTLVASQTLTNVAPNFNSGYGLIDLLAPGGMTQVTITPNGAPAAWDFLIDTIAFNQSITSVVSAPPPPPLIPPPAVPPVQGHRHDKGEGETELLEINFGDDVNDIRGSTVVLAPVVVPVPAAAWSGIALLTGLVAATSVRRLRRNLA